MLLTTAIDGFIHSKSLDISPTTIRIYRYALDKFVQFAGDKVTVESVTTAGLRAFFAWLKNEYTTPAGATRRVEHLSTGTQQQVWRALKSFFAWANTELGIPRVDTVKCPAGEAVVIQPFTEQEVKAILRAAEFTTTRDTAHRRAYSQRRASAARNVGIVMVLLDSGIRIGELSRLTLGDYDGNSGAILIRPFGTGKKTRSRMVYVGKSTRRAMWRYLAARDGASDKDAPLFATQDGKPFTGAALTHFIITLGKRAGIAHCHAHRFRHTFSVEYLKNSGDVFTLQRLLGHSTLAMTQKYIWLADADIADAHGRASPADKWRL